MNHAFNISTPRGQRAPDMGIDWEIQPSLQHLVVRTEAAHRDGPTWVETMPASLESMSEPAVFQEPLEGLSIREVNEPEIFRVFFGESERAAARA